MELSNQPTWRERMKSRFVSWFSSQSQEYSSPAEEMLAAARRDPGRVIVSGEIDSIDDVDPDYWARRLRAATPIGLGDEAESWPEPEA